MGFDQKNQNCAFRPAVNVALDTTDRTWSGLRPGLSDSFWSRSEVDQTRTIITDK